MTFWEHIDELRRCLVLSFFSIFFFSIIASFFSDDIREFLLNPIKPYVGGNIKLVWIDALSPFFLYISISFFTGLFISFFPQLIAGPILRASELVPQLKRIKLSLIELKFALLLFSFGALKKVGIADQIAPYVDQIYSNTNTISAGDAWLVLYAFSIQHLMVL